MDGPFEYLRPNFVANTTEDYQRDFAKILKTYKKTIKEDDLRGSAAQFRVYII